VIAEHMDDAVAEQFHGDSFVTGHLAHLDVATGELRWVNAGHPPPLLMRGAKVVGELACVPCFPFGLGISITEIGQCVLQPGDRVLFYSDGATEARPSGGEQFGVERLISEVEQFIGSGVLPSETLRRLAMRLRQHRGGELEDDATLVFLEWLPGR
jgi:serine phosphatase RsbU (regulator of sigma subunit)